MAYKELILKETETGCIIPISHCLNQDGYFRKLVNGTMIMYHRHMWQEVHGPIPEDHEIDHICKNRACCNVEHLQCLHKSVHRAKDNMERSGNLTGIPQSHEERKRIGRERYHRTKNKQKAA